MWQPDLLETEHLPNTFKHSNFASFVRQLNNYGFRKCHSDRFEFGVEGFEQGKPELLTSLRRHDAPRNKKGGDAKGGGGKAAAGSASAANARGGGGAKKKNLMEGTPDHGAQSLEIGAYGGITSEVEQLKRDRLLLLKEVMRLRDVQNNTTEEVRRLSARLQATEQFQSQMMSFVEAVQQQGGGANGLAGSFGNADEMIARFGGSLGPRKAARKRRQMFLPSSSSGGGGGGSGGGGGGGVAGAGVDATRSAIQEVQDEIDEIDDALMTAQAYGPLSPNPHAAIQLPENEGAWLDMLGGGDDDDALVDGVDLTPASPPRVHVGGQRVRQSPLITSMSDVDLALAAAASGGSGGNSPGETAVDDADAADQAAARRGERQRDPHPQPDAFVANILNRGPSLEKQLSLGFLDHMDSADIGEMVRDMNIGVGSAGSDEFTRRVDALSDVIK